VDIQPRALAAARHNAVRNGVGDRMQVCHSEVFSHVDDAVDSISVIPSFGWFAPRDPLEAAPVSNARCSRSTACSGTDSRSTTSSSV
jgi:hypothetical protein